MPSSFQTSEVAQVCSLQSDVEMARKKVSCCPQLGRWKPHKWGHAGRMWGKLLLLHCPVVCVLMHVFGLSHQFDWERHIYLKPYRPPMDTTVTLFQHSHLLSPRVLSLRSLQELSKALKFTDSIFHFLDPRQDVRSSRLSVYLHWGR